MLIVKKYAVTILPSHKTRQLASPSNSSIHSLLSSSFSLSFLPSFLLSFIPSPSFFLNGLIYYFTCTSRAYGNERSMLIIR